jgi:CheY-like chemotaxis protein
MQRTKILLVDDREDNLMSIEAILGQDGYEFFRAYSGTEALKILLAETDFALILMDVKMPVLNGFETATLIYEREKLKSIPIIFITANNYGDDNVYKGYQAGGIDYILKPINPQILRAKVNVFVNLYRAKSMLLEQESKLKSINDKLNEEIKDRKASEEKVRYMNFQLIDKIDQLERANENLKQLKMMLKEQE